MCIEEVNIIGRKGGSMNKESWVTLGKVLKEKFDMDTTQKQFKNAFDNLKAKYVVWKTNSFALVNTKWEEFKKGHPRSGSLRTHPLPYPNICASLFDGSSANGSIKRTFTQTKPAYTSSSSHRVQRLLINDNPFNVLEDDDGASNKTSDQASIDRAHGASTDRLSKRAKRLMLLLIDPIKGLKPLMLLLIGLIKRLKLLMLLKPLLVLMT
ncbi:unnamed protein product [Lactuca saligna]|uniref:Myb/SANT-like domain-containing protein n=1 Tax=Lactuca saligna TaxID=75948 RepID=A0AA35ZLI7_LACSI|nr:unnamed protein product [Lactuca saligna]